MPLRVLHLSTFDSRGGGSGRAAEALHRAEAGIGIDSTLITASGPRFQLASRADRALWRLQLSPLQTWRSPAYFGSLSAKEINAYPVDVVNLHWVTNGFLSIDQIGRITKPIIWSLYDMWPFAGTEHYPLDTPEARWRDGYTKSNRPADESGLDLDRLAWERKGRTWRPAHVVAASTWLAEAARSSALMHAWPISQVPHPIDPAVFSPMATTDAKENLGWSNSSPVLLFLSSAGIDDSRKGFDLLIEALAQVTEKTPTLTVAVVGPRPSMPPSIEGVHFHWHGNVNSNEELRKLYCAADVVVTPSRQDNMPLTAMEAQTCGRPVVAFAVGGLPDIVRHGATGYLAQPFDTADLAQGIQRALADSQTSNSWGAAARGNAITSWTPEIVAQSYAETYERALA